MLRIAGTLLILMTLLLGGAYPLLITFIAQHFFPYAADGSLLKNDKDEVVGSLLIAQKFHSPHYFWPRPSAVDYALPSGGSNLGPTSKKLQQLVADRKSKLKEQNPDTKIEVPADLVYASGSGLDPHISMKATRFQMQRVLKARGLNDKEKLNSIIEELVLRHIWERPFNYLNVLKINYELDKQLPINHDTTKSKSEQPNS